MRFLIRIALFTVYLTVSSALPFVITQENKSTDLFVVTVNDKCGFMDRSGKIVFEPQWRGASNFSEGRASVSVDSPVHREGYIDITGKVVIPAMFVSAADFKEGLAVVGDNYREEHWGGNFKEGLASGCDDCGEEVWGGNRRYGIIDLNGNWVIKPIFKKLYNFSDGLAAAVDDYGALGFIDKTGKVVIPFQFETPKFSGGISAGHFLYFGYHFSGFSEGLAPMTFKGKFGYINKSGKWAIKPQFTNAKEFVDGLAVVIRGGDLKKDYSGHYEIIERTGKSVIKFGKNVSRVESFSEGLAAVEVEKENGPPLTGFIDKSGRFVIEPKHYLVKSFSDGLAQFLENGKWTFMDHSGNIVLSTDYSVHYGFRRGLAKIIKHGPGGAFDVQNEKYGYMDKTGKVIWEPTR
jgi:hypothetical protein